MEYLLGLSVDLNCFPSFLPNHPCNKDCQFSIAAYSLENYHPRILRHETCEESHLLTNKLYERETEGFSTFLWRFTKEPIKNNEDNRAPFYWNYANRMWTLVCDLAVEKNSLDQLKNEMVVFSPLGLGVEELLLCWLLEEIDKNNALSLAGFGWQPLFQKLQSLSPLGRMTLIFTDGQDLVAFQSAQEKPFYLIKGSPPYQKGFFQLEQFSMQLGSADINRTFLMFTNQRPLQEDQAIALKSGQMIVARNGELVWNSDEFLEMPAVASASKASIPPEKNAPISLDNPLILAQTHQIPLLSKTHPPPLKPLAVITSCDPYPNTSLYYVFHETYYQYDAPVHVSKHLLRLQPLSDISQNLIHYQLTASVNGKRCNFTGVFGNHTTRFDVKDTYCDLKFTSRSLVVINPPSPQSHMLHQKWTFPLIWMPWDRIMLQAYLTPPELAESELYELSDYAMSFVKRNNNCVFEILSDINQTICRDYKYVSGSTTLSTTPFQVYCSRQGVCQDFANLFICLARLLNIPARYRIGYIFTGTDYENHEQGEATHAWVELYLPNVGWVGFDPTNNCVQGPNHIRVACGRNYRDATPTSGTIYRGGGEETLTTSVKVLKLSLEEFYERFEEFN